MSLVGIATFKQEMLRGMYMVSCTKFFLQCGLTPHGTRKLCLHHAAVWDVWVLTLPVCRTVPQHEDILWSASGGDKRRYEEKVRAHAKIKDVNTNDTRS